jgi:protein gp37
MKRTDIEWTANVLPDGTTTPGLSSNPIQFRDATGRVVWACVKKSSGCANCYAEAIALRFERGGPFTRATMEGLTPFLDEKELRHILTAKTIDKRPVAGSRCFLGDMTDVFGEWVPDALLDRLFAAIALRPDVTFQVLTKRADRMAAYFAAGEAAIRERWGTEACDPAVGNSPCACNIVDDCAWPLPNLWLGASVENQAAADERIPHLLATPAAVRFLSCEPLLGPIHLWPYRNGDGKVVVTQGIDCDWVIVGGESGPGARPMAVEWARGLVRQCQAAGTAVFVKQLGANPTGDYYDDRAEYEERMGYDWPEPIGWNRHDGQPRIGSRVELPLIDKKGGDLAEFPEDLRVRQFPEAA